MSGASGNNHHHRNRTTKNWTTYKHIVWGSLVGLQEPKDHQQNSAAVKEFLSKKQNRNHPKLPHYALIDYIIQYHLMGQCFSQKI